MIDPRKIQKNYRDQLDQWIQATGKSQKELTSFTKYFFAALEPLAESTISNTKKAPPSRADGRRNLYTLLGVLYLFEVVEEEVAKEFLEKYEVAYDEDGSWEDVWRQIQEGVDKAREDKERKPLSRKPAYTNHKIIAVLSLISLILIGTIVILSSKTSICTEPTTSSGSELLGDQGFSLYLPNRGMPSSNVLSSSVRAIGINQQGLWVGYAPAIEEINSVSLYNGETWAHCRGLPLGIGQNVNSFAFQDNRVFVATDGGGIAALENNNWHFYQVEQGLPSNSVYALYIDKQGQLWAGTYEGVALFDNGLWQTVLTASPDGMASNHVHALLEDREDNWWFGFIDRGISRLTAQGHWESVYTNASGWQNVRNIATDNEGGVWFATDGGGLLLFLDGRWTEFTAAVNQLPSFRVNDVERDQYGRIWAATDQGVVYTPDLGQTWITHSSMDTLDIEFGCTDCIYDENDLWLVLKDAGLGHVRIPPPVPTIEILSTPPFVQLHPGQSYIFSIEVRVIRESLTEDEGDSLRSSDPNDADLYGAYP